MKHGATRLGLVLGFALLSPAQHASANVGFRMVADTDTTPATLSSNPGGFFRFDSEVIFSATTPATGTELFATDGIATTARLVADILPNGASSNARVLGRVGNRLIVAAEVGETAGTAFGYTRHSQVVSVDPITGQHDVLTQFDPWYSESPGRFDRLAQTDHAVAFRDIGDGSIWASDGTVLGTQRIHAGNTVHTGSFCATHERFMFATSSDTGVDLWASNGLTFSTTVVGTYAAGTYVTAKSRGDGCYLLTGTAGPQWTVWFSNGKSGGTQVSAPAQGQASGLHVVNGAALVFAVDGAQKWLWRAGDDAPVWGGNASHFMPAVVVGDRLVFAVQIGAVSYALASDGTAEGTVALHHEGGVEMPWQHVIGFSPQLHSGDGYALVAGLSNSTYHVDPLSAQVTRIPGAPFLFGLDRTVVLDGAVIGSAYAGAAGRELWRSDGTAGGTHIVADVATATRSGAGPVGATASSADGVLFYAAKDDVDLPAADRHSLWRSDGTAAGTWRMPRTFYDEFDVTQVQALGGDVVFTTLESRPTSGGRLYRSDALFSTTTLVWEQSLSFYDLRTTSEAAFFNCPVSKGHTLCAFRTDATGVVPLLPGPTSFTFLGAVDETAFFMTPQGVVRSDGTSGGTALIGPDIRLYTGSTLVGRRLGERLLFQGCSAGVQNGCGLFVTDGTQAGTQMVSDPPGRIVLMEPLNDGIAFFVEGPERQLWVSDGSPAGTRLVLTLPVPVQVQGMASTGQRVHLLVAHESPGYLVSDGSPPDTPGTHWVFLPPGIRRDATAVPIAIDADNVVFRCYVERLGLELCGVDGDGEGFHVVRDFYQGPQSSTPAFIAHAGDTAYFSIDDGRHGFELWRTTGERIFADTFDTF